MFENSGYLHSYIPGAVADNPSDLLYTNINKHVDSGYLHAYSARAVADNPWDILFTNITI